jgi:hypothetical protein
MKIFRFLKRPRVQRQMLESLKNPRYRLVGTETRDQEMRIRREILIKLEIMNTCRMCGGPCDRASCLCSACEPPSFSNMEVVVDDSLLPRDNPAAVPALIVAALRKHDTGLTEEDAEV